MKKIGVLEKLALAISRIPQKAESGRIYRFMVDEGRLGYEFFEEFEKKLKTEIDGEVFDYDEFDYSTLYEVLCGHKTTLVKISETQKQKIKMIPRRSHTFSEGDIVVVRKGAKDEDDYTVDSFCGKVTDSEVFDDGVRLGVESGGYFRYIQAKDLNPYVLVVEQTEVRRNILTLRFSPAFPIKVYLTTEGLYGKSILVNQALRSQKIREEIKTFLDLWENQFDKFMVESYGGYQK